MARASYEPLEFSAKHLDTSKPLSARTTLVNGPHRLSVNRFAVATIHGMSPVESETTVYVIPDAGQWLCLPPHGIPEFHNTRHDALQCAILWAYANRPAKAVIQRNGAPHIICSYDVDGHAEVFETLGA